MSAPPPPRVRPARLSFLAIYSPPLGPTDETFEDQSVYWYSRKAAEARTATKTAGRNEAAGNDAAREDENEKLRQIGLAQGMVDFAKSFSNGQPVDSIETERSRIVLHELEQGWWILASIDLTRLPSLEQTPLETSRPGVEKSKTKAAYEYSSREVSPPPLLTQQLLQAHTIFLLHHGASLNELFVRLSREKFCNALDRFWSRFTRTWDVLLHGNPAADAFGGIKLASGGELGVGVGEEEWGSGEREVLEDLTHRTEGLLDLVVSRFGEPAQTIASDEASLPEAEALPWLGSGGQPSASDGVLFGGVGAVARASLQDVSLWMRQVYTDGEYAYGVKDNPLRERRKRRRRNRPTESTEAEDGSAQVPTGPSDLEPQGSRQKTDANAGPELPEEADKASPELNGPNPDARPRDHDRVAPPDHSLEIPAHKRPIAISKPDDSLIAAVAADRAPKQVTRQADVKMEGEGRVETDEAGSTWGVPDTYMKYLTFGLSELAKPSRPPATKRTTASSSANARPPKTVERRNVAKPSQSSEIAEPEPMMTHLEPTPDEELVKARLAAQRRQENRGYFVVGLQGDLDTVPDDADADISDGSLGESNGARTILRTLQIELAPHIKIERPVDDDETFGEAMKRTADDAESGNPALKNMQRVRVLVYVCRPFMYCFLFEDRTSSLAYPGFYKGLHKTLLAMHKPLLSSSNVAKVALRIEGSRAEFTDDSASVRSLGSNIVPPKSAAEATARRPIFDLIYDPRSLTVHTSIPNIPEPGTPAAEGLSIGVGRDQSSLPAGWTRLDALNVHSQVLSTLRNVKDHRTELERTSKTSRGWWVVWMKVPPSADAADHDSTSGVERSRTDAVPSTTASRKEPLDRTMEGLTGPSTYNTRPSTRMPTVDEQRKPADMHRMAFLVRKATDAVTSQSPATTSTSSRVASGMWNTLTLRTWEATDELKTGGAGASWGPAALSGGIGIDARKYVEGLLSLNR
ncbi:hypothetical protein LTR53_001764 [Teratosphaeriaceae sp. CCFEE 6253]|nr:hypothetical protein LTR53_001764 [Teratosphaeriaceae sp. CCFEE 6253]